MEQRLKITISFQEDALTPKAIAQFHKGWAVGGRINYRSVLRFISREMKYTSFTSFLTSL